MGNWLVQSIVKAILEWLLSLWVRFLEKEKQKEEGRQEVRKEIQDKTDKLDNEFKKIDDTDITIDDALNRLRLRSDRVYNQVSGPGSTDTSSGGST